MSKDLSDAAKFAANEVAFKNAKFYDGRDPEVLNHTELEEALVDVFDTAWEKGMTVEQHLEECCPVEISAYNPMKIDMTIAANRAECVLEDFEEYLHEDYGNMDGDHDFWSKEERKSIEEKLTAVFREALEKAEAWQCEVVATKSFSAEEVKALIPEYFER